MLCRISIGLTPHHCVSWPDVKVGIDDSVLYQGTLVVPIELDQDLYLDEGKHVLWVSLSGKGNANSGTDSDQAIQIDSISFEGMTADRFIWAGIYEPEYPEPWYSQQQIKPGRYMHEVTYLGFNGTWRLEFSTPIFRWIHEIEHLGWIYD